MKPITIIGPCFGSSGFVSHCRQLANALDKEGVDVRIETPLIPDWVRYVNDAELKMIQKPRDMNRVAIFVGQPQFLPLIFGDGHKEVIPFVIHEGDKLPRYWIKFLADKRVKQVWVASSNTKEAIINTIGEAHCYQDDDTALGKEYFEKLIHVIPHGVDLNIFKEQPKPERFSFVCNKGWSNGMNDRGGVQFVAQAFCEEFNKNEPVDLKIKINPAYCPPGWNLVSELNKIPIENKDRPLVNVRLENIPYEEVPTVYQGHVFVCASMGEAFNLPGLEAHACGLPSIQNKGGGQEDYMTLETDIKLIEGELVDAPDLIYEGVKWVKPNIIELRKAMRWCFNNKDWCLSAGKRAMKNAEDWTWKQTALKAVHALQQL